MTEWKDRVAVITGAAGEIPACIAELLASNGVRLVLTDVDDTKLDQLSATLGQTTSVITVRQNVADPEDADKLKTTIRETFNAVDFLITGAGIYENTALANIDATSWQRSISINLDGAFYTTQALRPMLTSNSAIVNVASLAGHQGSVNHTPYATAKGGILALTRSLAQELAPNTRVNAVSPGLIDTK